MARGFYLRCGKRALDVFLTVVALILLWPIAAVVALLVRTFLGSPVLFRQERPGRYGMPFFLSKFRTMTSRCDTQGKLLPDTERLTRFGRFLRGTSLDELPELLNVLRGEMSLVGPRPLLLRYQPFYNERERKRFEVLPGITGWAQINGRNNVSWNERLQFDVWYAENASLPLDLKILALTILRTVRREGVQADPASIMLDLDAERARDARQNTVRAD
jgi:lipopolysaccharide/colanic/teichoic acid biosynthesis glycosyltransferase